MILIFARYSKKA